MVLPYNKSPWYAYHSNLPRGFTMVLFHEWCNNTSNRVLYFLQAMKRILWKTIYKAVTIIDAGMYKGICKCNSSRFKDETLSEAKFMELKETSFLGQMKYVYPCTYQTEKLYRVFL